MSRTRAALLAAVAVLIPSLAPSLARAQPTTRPAKPNVLFILIDDMGYGDLTCYDPQAAPTPRIDQLAREGIRFTQYYSGAPICSPSRCALLTGQYPQRWRITSYIDNRRMNEDRGMAQWLELSAPSLARQLHEAGYATGHFGKWHLGGGRDVGEAPLISEYGYDETLTQFEGLGDRLLGLFDKHDGSKPERSGLCTASERLGRGKIEWVDRSEETSRFADRAIQFMDQAVAQGKPFYVDLWPDDVHSPFYPPKALRTSEAKRQLYRAVVRATDQQLTKLLDHVRDTPALRDNTILILASDNGPEPGAGTAGPFRGFKGNLYEGGIREPFIVWAPAFIDPVLAGTTNDASVIVGVDLAPSVLALAHVQPPANARFDGQDVANVLLGRARTDRAAPIFWRRPPDRPGPQKNPFPDLAMRDGDWKFLCMRDGSAPQLYNLKDDAGESHNLADAQPDRVQKMTAAVRAWNDTLPADKPQSPRANGGAETGG